MSVGATPCPSPSEIERLVTGDPVPLELGDHVRECEACRRRLDDARQDAEFLGRVRSLAGRDLGPQGAPRLPGYRTIGVVSSGGQGVVYRAIQESTSRKVAIKTLMDGRTASPRQRVRAEREAEIAARLRHPNIVTVFESRTLSDGRIAVVMEFVDGVPIDSWKPSRSADPKIRLLEVFVAVCNAVHHAHLNGVIHRDLKPDNILVTPEGRAVVVDFGIAKIGGIPATLTGEFAGTPAYASPEQVSGQPDEVNALTDVYSLGVILYRLICGRMPHHLEGSIFDMARTIAHDDPIPPREHDATIHRDLEAIVMRAIRKEKDRRYQSAASLGRDVERYLAGRPVEARSGSGWYLLRKAVSINRGRLAWIAAAGAVCIAAVVLALLSLASASASRQQAELQRRIARSENVRARAVTELLREALPHADPRHPEIARVIDLGLSRLFARLETGGISDDPDLDQALRRLWGSVYTGFGGNRGAGQVAFAEISLRNGLVRLKMQYGQEHPEIAATMHELAGVLLIRDRTPEAERFGRAALEMRRRLLGEKRVETIESHALLARCLVALGMIGEATREADTVLTASLSLPEHESDLMIASMSSLKAEIRMSEGDHAGAEPLIREALVRRFRRLPVTDPDVIASMHNAADLIEGGVSEGALVSLLGSYRDGTGSSVSACIRRDMAVLASADLSNYLDPTRSGRTEALGRMLSLQEGLLGPDDPSLVGTLMSLARAAWGEGHPEIRLESARRAADLLSARFGPRDLSVMLPLQEAAGVASMLGRGDLAIDSATRVCEIWDGLPEQARDMSLTANSRRLLAQYMTLDGRHAEAIPVYRRAVTELEAAFGDVHHVVALARAGLACSLTAEGMLEEADRHSRDALRMGEGIPATSPDQLTHLQFARGHVLVALGRFDEGTPLLQEAWDVYYKYLDPTFAWRRALVLDMTRCARGGGNDELARTWESRLDSAPARSQSSASDRSPGSSGTR